PQPCQARTNAPRSSTAIATWGRSPPSLCLRPCGTRGASTTATREDQKLPQEVDVVCLGGGVAGEAIAHGLQGSGSSLVVVERELVGGECPYWGCEPSVARKAVVIANGGTAAIPPIPGLDQVEYWTNRHAAIPRELPNSLAVLGGGAIGVELGQAFARVGTRVTIIEAGPRFLGLEEPEAGAALQPHLEMDGITVMA